MLTRFLTLMVVSLTFCCGCTAETLREILLANQFPIASFLESELSQRVHAEISAREQFVLVAYQQVNGKTIAPPLQLVRYAKNGGAVARSILLEDTTDVCAGSLAQINFVGEFTLVSTHISPSAQCILVLGRELELIQTLYGFRPLEIAPGQVVLIENTIHFSPVHPERLQWADLNLGMTTELYPPAGDVSREQLAKKHSEHMPAQETCMEMNDPCTPDVFDEEIGSIDTDGKGRFSFVVRQSANHVVEKGKASRNIASQAVLYVYAKNGTGWSYCAKKIDDSDGLGPDLDISFATAASRCTPKLPVLTDSSAATNQFDRR